jgi:outer membrane protein assembly factor BamE (lipoprotein component of BamABCDE complex)
VPIPASSATLRSIIVSADPKCRSKVDQEHYYRIQNGMTEQQVYEILGKPRGK